jgi:hypothetical protein
MNKRDYQLGFIVLAITGLETLALCLGVNGVGLSASITALGGIGGYLLKTMVDKKRVKPDNSHHQQRGQNAT